MSPRLDWSNATKADRELAFVNAKLNPSSTHQTQHQSGWEQQQNFGGGEIIFTDDISLSVFMQHLAKLAVAELISI